MKTAISLPDELFVRVEHAAKRLGISRSEVFSRAVRRYLETAGEAEIRESYDAAFGDAADETRTVRRAAARKVLRSVRWDPK